MPVVRDPYAKGPCKYVAGYWDKDGKLVRAPRKHWKEILTEDEIAFIRKRLEGPDVVVLPPDDSATWQEIHQKVKSEGWMGWRFISKEIKGISLIPIDKVHEETTEIDWKDYKKGTPVPPAPLLEEFVHEPEAWEA
jgi:hypothetical protein